MVVKPIDFKNRHIDAGIHRGLQDPLPLHLTGWVPDIGCGGFAARDSDSQKRG
jgi:hypothetical protein